MTIVYISKRGRRILWCVGIVPAMLISGCAAQSSTAQSDLTSEAGSESPLGNYEYIAFAIVHPDLAVDSAGTDFETVLAQCMSRQGFVYFPESSSVEEIPETPEDPSDYDFVSGQIKAAAEAGKPSLGSGQNSDYLETLTKEGRAAYQVAMYGPASQEQTEQSVATDDIVLQGCLGEALVPESARSDEFAQALETSPYLDLAEKIEALGEGVVATSEWKALDQEWSVCMEDAGYQIATQYDVIIFLTERMDLVLKGQIALQVQLNSSPGETPSLDAQTAKLLKDLQGEEEALFRADQQCADSSKLTEGQNEQILSAEQSFYTENQVQLRMMADWYEQIQHEAVR